MRNKLLGNTTAGDLSVPSKRQSNLVGRAGAVLVLCTFLLVIMIAMVAFAVDMGYIVMSRAGLQCAADAAALAGTGTLSENPEGVQAAVIEYIQRNTVAGRAPATEDIETIVGTWDDETRTFQEGGDHPWAVRVRIRLTDTPLFFARVLGMDSTSISAEATAVFQPRDVMVVLDYSGSMNDDSELKSINALGRTAIVDNLAEIYRQLGSPVFGNMQWNPVYISTTSSSKIKKQLGLDRVAYPYPSGSWDDYFNYVQTNSNIRNAGYRKRYGYLTLVNYWLEKRPMYSQTPDLWMTSEQPITAVKDALAIFLGYIQEVKADDRVGLAVYTYSDDTAKLETGLTRDMQTVEDISRHRQAGHYDTMTNIGAGLRKARLELEENGRRGAFKMIVLMTDGQANLPSSGASSYLLQEAQLCADDGYPVVAVSLGSGADQRIMQQVADITGGIHFNIPGGQSVDDYEEQLEEVFRKIAAHRPLRIVK